MMDQLMSLLTDYTFQVVALGTGFLGLLSGVIGTYATLRGESLLGDALSHAALPGIAIGFLLIGRKEWVVLMLGAAVSGLAATALIQWMSRKRVVKFDSALSLILSSFFGLGLVLLTHIQGSANANQAGLDTFIYGQASAMLIQDVQTIAGIGAVLLLVVGLFWKEFKAYTFDPVFTQTLGFSGTLLEFLLSTMMVVVIILGLESVGVILMSALVVGPSVAARQWSDRLSGVMGLSGLFGFLSGVIGTTLSSIGHQIPTGPTIVVVLSIFVMASLLFAPKRGLLMKRLEQKKRRQTYAQHLQTRKEANEYVG